MKKYQSLSLSEKKVIKNNPTREVGVISPTPSPSCTIGLHRLFNNCIKLYRYYISSSWNIKRRRVKDQIVPPPKKKNILIKLSLSRVKFRVFLIISYTKVNTCAWLTSTGFILMVCDLFCCIY